MKNIIIALVFISSSKSIAQNVDSERGYFIVHIEHANFNIVMKGKPTKEKIKHAIKEICDKYDDDKICVSIWSSIEYYRNISDTSDMCIALYNPRPGPSGKWSYWLTFPDTLLSKETPENLSAFRY